MPVVHSHCNCHYNKISTNKNGAKRNMESPALIIISHWTVKCRKYSATEVWVEMPTI